jgi:hypothetical protein
LERPAPSGLADVVEVILDKGIVIDAYVRVSLLGIELLTIDARVVIASVDTYLRFAEATNRLDLEAHQGPGLTEVVGELGGGVVENVASNVVESKVGGVAESVGDKVDSARDALRTGVDRAKGAVGSVLPGGADDERPG